MPEPCGGGVDHSSDLGTADFGSGSGIFWQTGFGGHRGQVGQVAVKYSWNRVLARPK